MKVKIKISDTLFEGLAYFFVIIAGIITLYPFIYVLSLSISSPMAVVSNQVYFLPKGLYFEAYKKILTSGEVWTYYYNTVWYTCVGTAFNVFFTILAAYPLSKKYFFARNFFTVVFVFTMFFGGGLIPTFVLMCKLGLYDSRWAMVLPGLISTYNMIICRTFFQSLPEELFENARLEGCSEFKIIQKIVLPLSKPIAAVLVLYYGVAHWNSFLTALIYLPSVEKHPIQVFLRRVVVQNSSELMETVTTPLAGNAAISMIQMKYAVIIVAILPIIVLYPFLQKYFVKGVMIGALKG